MKKLCFFPIFFLFVTNLFGAVNNLVWKHDYLGVVDCIKTADLYNNGDTYIVTGGQAGVSLLNSKGEVLWRKSSIGEVYKLEVKDLDNDGVKEIIGSSYLDFFVVSADGSNMIVENVMTFSTSPVPFVVADIDNDGKKEVVVKHNPSYTGGSSSYGVYVYNYSKNLTYLQLKWYKFINNIDLFNDTLACADINGDGKKYVVTDTRIKGADNETLVMINPDDHSLDNVTVPHLSDNFYVDFLKVIDSDNNGKDEIALGYGYEGKLISLDPITGNTKWLLDTEMPVREIVNVDFDNDGYKDLAIITNNKPYLDEATSNKLALYDFKNNTLNLKWEKSFDNATNKASLYGIKKYKTSDMLVSLGHRLIMLNAVTGDLIWVKTVTEDRGDYYYKVKYDLLPSNEIIAGGVNFYKLTENGDKSIFFENGLLVNKVIAGDMTGNGVDEVAVLDERAIHLYSNSGNLLWSKTISPDNAKFADLYNNGKKELVVTSGNGKYIKVFDINGNIVWDNNSISFPKQIEIADFNNDGYNDVIVSAWGKIVVFDKIGNILLEKTVSSYGGNISSMKIYDINNDGKPEIIYTLNFLTMLDNNGNNLAVSAGDWQYKNINIISNNKIVCSHDKEIILMDNNTAELWKYSVDNSITDVKIRNNYIYVTDGKKIYKIDINGNLIWSYYDDNVLNNFKPMTLAFVDSYIVSGGYKLYILEDATGNLLHTIDPANNPQYMYQGYMCPVTNAKLFIDKNNIIFGQMGVYAYGDKGTLPSDNGSASTVSITVEKNWNLLGLPVDNNVDVSKFDNVSTIWKWVDNKWEIYSPVESIKTLISNYKINTFSQLSAGEGFWIKNSNKFDVSFSGNSYGIDKLTIGTGWNLLGIGEDINDFTIFGDIKTLWQWSGSVWRIWSPDSNIKSLIKNYGIDEINSLKRGEGFWVNK